MYTIINWIINQKLSLLFYISAIVMLILYGLFDKGFFTLSMILFSFGVIYDTIIIFKKSHNTYWEKFIYLGLSIIAYFSYILSESIAQNIIYDVVQVNPELFGLSLAYFKGIYFLVAVALFTGFTLAFGLLLFLSIVWIPMFLEMVGFNKNKLQSIKIELIHSLFYISATMILIFTFLNDNEKLYNSFFGENHVAKKVINYSYFPNKTCTNIKKGVYIKFLDSDLVSVSNINETIKNKISNDTNFVFEVKRCEQKISI